MRLAEFNHLLRFEGGPAHAEQYLENATFPAALPSPTTEQRIAQTQYSSVLFVPIIPGGRLQRLETVGLIGVG
jgi:hypothetical protein